MDTIQLNAVVGMHYTLKNDAGELLDSSDGGDALIFLHGHGNIIPGLEAAVAGMKVGDSKDVVVEPAEGYGEYRDDLIQEVPRSAFAGIEEIEVGMQFLADTEEGITPITVRDVTAETITVDGNHELAGERLHFAVTIESIREATADEIAHGHIHGDDDEHCHDHGCGCSH